MRMLFVFAIAVIVVGMTGMAQAQSPGTVVPQVTSPQTTGSTVQGTSDATTKAMEAPAKAKSDKDKKDEKQVPPKDKDK